MLTTPPPPTDLLARFPGLEKLGRTTTRLHPRPASVDASQSHVGGPLRWPADEPWPTCEVPPQAREEVPIPLDLLDRLRAAETRRTRQNELTEEEAELYDEIARLVGPGYTGWGSMNNGPVVGYRYRPRPHPRPNPMVALAQLRAEDVPDLPRPGGADLLQVLWCPFDHAQDGLWGPTVRLYWRREAEVSELLADPPRGDAGRKGYLPKPCRLHPEQVVEYPYPEELPADLVERVDAWEGDDDGDDGGGGDGDDDDEGPDYVGTFMVPGWKVGGYANWSVTDLAPTPCPQCAGPTTLALVIDSTEGDAHNRDRWQPVEERQSDEASSRALRQESTGVSVGRWGALRIFVCERCPDVPFRLNLQ
ncbi:hypothetical protein I0C86_14125 [Plantactinospora sp. S1510]|uniref:DUF1963 domain-containing protein n=1 Tax=Plantactinospora alkalitolerans TaxID=2789879 RepID=A0ABS0GUZ4_9ACTN|nr:hypothetical protein [Plantactinospora alkalitolerans]MBF9130038.1 hypothetical protein [Plantactinospora alkalitolerans]MBF9130086.1 hypothetical protein [Plantactinospora alkalitolerans]